ncbi:MAG: putative esterase of the alpha-beta hydrolase superfamily [Firmicutes bacterium]|nr:putative esterase of the alpha-beta hydrolase superfamily [Bacillota bacterium]MBP2629654.1 putative esterase of the alpha-beta hydrolase superfamily [Bacillota bacterium]
MPLKCDAVFEGGGVKGIGLAGAVSAIQNAGYEFQNMAGTSAGAIIASLLAVGFTGDEIGKLLKTIEYQKFRDETAMDHFGLPGKTLNIAIEYGIYKGDYFESWLENLLRSKGKTTFGDIKINNPSQEKYKYKFCAIASDITDKKLLILPESLKDFGIDPDQFSISRAVRMSMSIPLFYEPIKLIDSTGRTHYIVDGGVLSNYPIWLLDDGTSTPEWPTFGFKLTEFNNHELPTEDFKPIDSLTTFLESLIGTMMSGNDKYHISKSLGDFSRTINISTTVNIKNTQTKIYTTDFDITQEESQALFNNGVISAQEFLKEWNFETWKQRYRQNR